MTAALAAELDAAPLDAEVPAPVTGAALDGRLHLCGGPPGDAPVHLAIDASGKPVVAPHNLDVPGVVAMAAAADGLVLVCAGRDPDRAGAGLPVLAALDGGGGLLGTAELALGGPLAQWPLPVAVGGQAWLVWAEGQPSGPASVRACRWEVGERPGAPVQLAEAGGGVAGLAVAGGDAGLVAWHGTDGPVRLVGLRGGQAGGGASRTGPGERAVLARVAPAADGWWLLWLERDAGPARLQRLDADLAAVGDVVVAAEAGPGAGATVRDARLLPGGGHLAVDVQVARPAPGRRHGEELREWVAAGPGGPATDLAEPGVAYRAAGWLGDRLVLVHGRSAPLVTVLSPA